MYTFSDRIRNISLYFWLCNCIFCNNHCLLFRWQYYVNCICSRWRMVKVVVMVMVVVLRLNWTPAVLFLKWKLVSLTLAKFIFNPIYCLLCAILFSSSPSFAISKLGKLPFIHTCNLLLYQPPHAFNEFRSRIFRKAHTSNCGSFD